MFEDIIVTPKSDTSQVQEPQVSSSQVNLGADELMDEIFHDLEAHLEHPDAVESLALSTEVSSRTGQAFLQNLRSTGLRRQSSEDFGDDLLVPYAPMDSTLALQRHVDTSLSVQADSKGSAGFGRRLLMTSACVSLVGVSMFWVGRQLRFHQSPVVAAVPPPEAIAGPEVNPETIEFANYVNKSVELIARETKAAKVAAVPRPQVAPATNKPKGGLPNLPNTPNVGVASSAAAVPNTAERVYVPVAEAPIPSLKSKPLTPPAQPSTPPAKTEVIAAATSAEKTDSLPELKPLPMTPPSNGERKFLGGTNLGNKPVFMVSINGSTRHIKLGEAIDETGATFVEFDGEQSVLKQGTQLRSVTAGQSF